MNARRIVATLVAVTVGGALALTLLTLNGFSARAEPSAAERIVAGLARRWATPRGAGQQQNPVAFSAEVGAEARAHFADHCASCHANDGSGQTPMGRNLYPRVPDMRLASTQQLSDGALYWIIQNGVRLSGMPAFGAGIGTDLDTWKLVHFIRRLNTLTPEQLKAMEALNPKSPGEIEEERADQEFLSGHDDNKETTQ